MRKQSIAERLASKVVRHKDCLLWIGNKDKKGYGLLRVGSLWRRAHRLNYAVHHGEIPPGAVIRHMCDNPSCIEPTHLLIGSQADNVRDMFDRGRANKASGERNPKAKLTAEQVAEIRRLYKPHTYGCGAHVLAKRFGISKPSIYAIVKRKTWRTATTDFPTSSIKEDHP